MFSHVKGKKCYSSHIHKELQYAKELRRYGELGF